jgi:hypothetical protein
MTEFMEQNNTLLVEAEIKFNNIPINFDGTIDLCLPTNEPTFFGIIDIRVNESPITIMEQTINIAIDCSGSMSDNCSDGKEKIDHIKHTVKNILNYILKKPQVKILLNVFSFNNTITDILINETVNEANVDTLKEKINGINAEGGTNIEVALKKFIELNKEKGLDCDISNIFMSDGYANEGIVSNTKLTGLVNDSNNNTFIGFGIEHNPKLLSDLSSGNKSAYFYIDVLENAGNVYGEILHGILYKRFENTILTIENGLVYNWKTNSWSTSLLIGDLISDTYKQYHIISHNCDDVKCVLTANDILTANDSNHILTCENSNNNFIEMFEFNGQVDDLSKFYFRQQTLQFLFKSRKFNDDYNTDDDLFDFKNLRRNSFMFDNNEDEANEANEADKILTEKIKKEKKEKKEKKDLNIKLIKSGMKELIKQMEKYVKDNNIEGDKFIKNLCIDIAICYNTLGTSLGHMYSCSRQSSQGTQRIHSVRTPVSKNNYNINVCVGSDSDDDSDYDSVFTTLQTPRNRNKYKNNNNISFDSLDHLLNNDNDNDNDNNDDEIINKYIIDDYGHGQNIDSEFQLDSPYYCSNSLINTIRTVSNK